MARPVTKRLNIASTVGSIFISGDVLAARSQSSAQPQRTIAPQIRHAMPPTTAMYVRGPLHRDDRPANHARYRPQHRREYVLHRCPRETLRISASHTGKHTP
jgi:hypothetical protein